MKTVVISQPMFLPWRGIFEQIALADTFIYYDDVQLPRGGGAGRGFNTRVQIKNATGWQWLSVPVIRPEEPQRIDETRFVDQRWRRKHLNALTTSYRKAPHFEQIYRELIEPIYGIETEQLSRFCIESTDRLMKWIGLAPELLISSHLEIAGGIDPSERVLRFCQRVGATDYISGRGGMNYLRHDLFESAGVRVHYMKYENRPYSQLHGEFNPYVSILDLLVHTGGEARTWLTSRAHYWREWPELAAREAT